MAKPKPEALPTDIFGQYLFANDRKDIKAVEDNTAEEDGVGGDFIEYYEDNKKPALAKRMPELFAMLKAGKYKPLLAPPKAVVFRGMIIARSKIDKILVKNGMPTLAAQYQKTGDATPIRVIKGPGKIKPVGPPIQGWSLSIGVASDFAEKQPARNGAYVPVIFVAKTTTPGNVFVGNPKIYNTLEPSVDDERETLSYGTVIYDKILIAPVVYRSGYDTYMFSYDVLRKLGYRT
jgi:hypothetical protein